MIGDELQGRSYRSMCHWRPGVAKKMPFRRISSVGNGFRRKIVKGGLKFADSFWLYWVVLITF